MTDPTLTAVFSEPPENRKYPRKVAIKTLDKESAAIMAILQGSGEAPIRVVHDYQGGGMIVVTDRRTFEIKRGKIRKELRHDEIAETRLGTLPNGDTLVIIESQSSRLDYSPNDAARFDKIIQPTVPTPRIGNELCAAIDQYL